MAISEGWRGRDMGAAADQILSERRKDEVARLHNELLTAIKTPHWSTTPAFWVGVVAMVASCVAAYYSYLAYVQPQQSSPVVLQPENIVVGAQGASPPELKPSPNSQLPQTAPSKK